MRFIIKLLFVALLQLIPFTSFSQKCYDIYEDAKYLYLLKQFEYKNLSDSILDNEIAKGTKNFKIYLLKSRILYEKGESSKGFPLLLTAVKYGCDFHHHIFTNNFFKKHITSSDSSEILKLAERDVEIPFRSSNQLALVDLLELVNWDQAVNWFFIKNKDSIKLSQKQYRVFHNKLINEMLLEDYLEKYGIPNEQEFGASLVDRFEIAVIHLASSVWLKPFYDEAYTKNVISPERYFNFYDGLLVEKSLPQKYGAFEGGKMRNGKYYSYPIENIENIDSLRKSVCLPPLHVYLRNNNYQMPDGYSYELAPYLKSIRNKLRK